MLLWDCPSECDYNCQHIVTSKRLSRDPPFMEPIYQFHGKWPFYRFMGMQEPFSVIFSLFNYLAHAWGVSQLREKIPASYPLRKYYMWFGYFGLASWVASMIFHTRDFGATEKLDYFAAGASVLYGMYFTVVRVCRLDRREDRMRQSLLRLWTVTCILLYTMHVGYLTLWRWDYTYNMAANVAVGCVQNLLWSCFSFVKYRRVGRVWAMWPGLIVAWILLAMSFELLDFPPWGGMVDAHSLWHLGTVGPTIWWYKYVTPILCVERNRGSRFANILVASSSKTPRKILRVRDSSSKGASSEHCSVDRLCFVIAQLDSLTRLDPIFRCVTCSCIT